MIWKVADAKNRFSELVTKALTEGPQRVRRRDQTVVVLSEADYERLRGEHMTLQDYLLSDPSNNPNLDRVDLRRDPSPMRDTVW